MSYDLRQNSYVKSVVKKEFTQMFENVLIIILFLFLG